MAAKARTIRLAPGGRRSRMAEDVFFMRISSL
jgi:hypothetical protein